MTYRLLDLAAEDVDAEDLGVVVAFCEGEAVALWRAVMATHTEQDLVDGVVGDLCACLRIQQPDRNSTRQNQTDNLTTFLSPGYLTWQFGNTHIKCFQCWGSWVPYY